MSALPRRGFLGVAPEDRGGSVVVSALAPGAPAARADLAVGDAIVEHDGAAVTDATTFRERLSTLRAGDTTRLTIERDDDVFTVDLVADARPAERYEGLAVRYGEALNGTVRLRTISVSPEGEGPWPCVYFVQGYGVASVERPENVRAADALRGLVEALAREGFCVWRTEKRGAGDSDGPPSADARFEDEREDFAAGLCALFADPWVDKGDVTIFGHSVGALHAPVLARRDRRVAAVALYGAGLHPWSEYLVENARRQCALAGVDGDEAGRVAMVVERFAREALIEGLSLDECFARWPELGASKSALGVDARGRVHERTLDYWRGVERDDVAGELRRVGVPLLAMWGSADWLSTRDEHQTLARLCGGRFVEVVDADHGFFTHTSQRASYEARWSGRFQPRVAEALVAWLSSLRRNRTGEHRTDR